MSGSYDVKDLFQKMGVTEAFSNQADFSGVVEKNPLSVSKVSMQTDVNQEICLPRLHVGFISTSRLIPLLECSHSSHSNKGRRFGIKWLLFLQFNIKLFTA